MQRPSILQLEQAFLHAWPALETVEEGGLVWRFANNYTKRANSAQAMDPSSTADPASELDKYVAWASERTCVPTFRVTPMASDALIGEINRRHWSNFEESVVMAMPVGAAFHPKHKARYYPANNPEWYEVQAEMSGYGTQTIAALKKLLDALNTPSTGVLLFDDQYKPAAAALTSNKNGIAFYNNVVVRADLRGKGYGRSVMQSALNWSRTAGAEWAAIQVVAENTPAINLYKSLGFSEVYRYHYRRPVK